MQQKRDNTRRNLIASLSGKFQQDEAIARGKYKGLLSQKDAKPCAPHNYRRRLDNNGEFWQCNCGQSPPHAF